MKTKAVSYSLWGNNPVYLKGAVDNAKAIQNIMPEWEMVVWYDSDVLINQEQLLTRLTELGVQTKFRPPKTINNGYFEYGMFWRLRTLDNEKYSHVIFRDLDSRITPREVDAVNQWVESCKTLHIIRDHPAHLNIHPLNMPGILGGLWGFKKPGKGFRIGPLIDQFVSENPQHRYGVDQQFLQQIYEQYKHDALIHDEVTKTGIAFRIKREDYSFIGERIDECGNPNINDRMWLESYLKSDSNE